jgi:hypothetical protein
MFAGELPHEVVVSIQRVLEIQPTEEVDRLDGLSERFNAVEILNDFFPDGASFILWFKLAFVLKFRAEASLFHIDAVSSRLLETQEELQKEIDSLQAELRVSQDPERMLVIQEMISVSGSAFHVISSLAYNFLQDLLGQMTPHQRKGY